MPEQAQEFGWTHVFLIPTLAPVRMRDSHDQHYKTLLRAFLKELLQITHPDLVDSLDFSTCRFLDKETYSDLLHGKGYRLDLVCEIRTLA